MGVRRPVCTNAVLQTENAVSSPVMPEGALANSRAFSSAVCGAWSVAIMSIVPSASASISACRSASVRSGGFMRA